MLTLGKTVSGVFSDPHQIRQTSGESASQPDDMWSPSAGASHLSPSLRARARATEANSPDTVWRIVRSAQWLREERALLEMRREDDDG